MKLTKGQIDSRENFTTNININKDKLSCLSIDIVRYIESLLDMQDEVVKIKNISILFDTNIEKCIMIFNLIGVKEIINNIFEALLNKLPESSVIYVYLSRIGNIVTISIQVKKGVDKYKNVYTMFRNKNFIDNIINSNLIMEVIKDNSADVIIDNSGFYINIPIDNTNI